MEKQNQKQNQNILLWEPEQSENNRVEGIEDAVLALHRDKRTACEKNCLCVGFNFLSLVFFGLAVGCACSDNDFGKTFGIINCSLTSVFWVSAACFIKYCKPSSENRVGENIRLGNRNNFNNALTMGATFNSINYKRVLKKKIMW